MVKSIRSRHYHLLVETPDANLSLGMRQLNGVYTQHFNHDHHRVGHVFQGRFKGILVEREAYLLELCRYIVLNPVRAEMVRCAKDWSWSSYRATCMQVNKPAWLVVDAVLSVFGRKKSEAIKAYRQFVSDGKGQPNPMSDLKNQIYLGSTAFVEEMLAQADVKDTLQEIPAVQCRPVAKSIAEYAELACDRDTAIYDAYRSGAYSMREIGDFFGLHYSRVSRILRQIKINN